MAAARKKSNGKGKGSNMAASIVWFFVVLTLIFAFYQIPPNRVTNGLGDALVAKSETMQSWISDKTSNIEIPEIKLFD